MEFLQSFAVFVQEHLPAFIIYQTVWTIIGCWFAARGNQKIWFIVIALTNTLGLLEIIYLATQKGIFENVNLQKIIMLILSVWLFVLFGQWIDGLEFGLLESIKKHFVENPIHQYMLIAYEISLTYLGFWFAARSGKEAWTIVMTCIALFGIPEIIYLATQTSFFKNINLND